MATIDTTIVHIKIKPSKFCNPVRPPATVSTSNGHQICMRAPFWVHEYLMESSRSHLSNGSSFIAKFHPSRPKSQKEGIGLICIVGSSTFLPNRSYHNSPKDRANNSLECREELRVHQVVSELSLLGRVRVSPLGHGFNLYRDLAYCLVKIFRVSD
ncbi:OSJNBa0042P21.11 [Oryza sativa (japonica cultivar-group)]